MIYKTLFLLLFSQPFLAQSFVTEQFEEKTWVLHSNLNIPAAKFHLSNKMSENEGAGFLELFASYGVGLSFNYGKAHMERDLQSLKVDHSKTEFSNIFGFQTGLLFSSKVEDVNVPSFNSFSIYGGLNILDLQLGIGYELGSRLDNTTGYFISMSYGIPLYKLKRKGSFIIKPKPKRVIKVPESLNKKDSVKA